MITSIITCPNCEHEMEAGSTCPECGLTDYSEKLNKIIEE